MAIKGTQRGGQDAGRGDAPYNVNYRTSPTSMPTPTINTPMVAFDQPKEEKRSRRSAFIDPREIESIALGQFMPDLNPYT